MIDSENPLCCLALVQLLTDTGRIAEALPVLHHMIEKDLLIEQSLLFLGDVHMALGSEETGHGELFSGIDVSECCQISRRTTHPDLGKSGTSG